MERVRYYAYVSDAKLDMLYDQIPAKIRSRLVAELKLDVKVVSLSLRERESDATRYGKLDVVESYLERHVDVGSIAEPAAWFRGRVSLRSGLYRNAPGGLAYFSGLDGGVRLALIGSARHLIGSQTSPAEIGLSYSGLPALFTILRRDEASPAQEQDDEQRAVAEVREFADALGGLPEPSEFLARRLLHGPVADAGDGVTHVLLGTPLYVALADA
jgi:hypothetical protein